MKVWQYWLGWCVMAVFWLTSLIVACVYIGAKLDAILRVLRDGH